MPSFNTYASDAMIERLSTEVEERNAYIQGLIAGAQDKERDLTDTEKAQLNDAKARIGSLNEQLESLSTTADIAAQVHKRSRELDKAVQHARHGLTEAVEYRSAGAYLLDQYKASLNDREASERLEVFERAAAHQKTSDNLGLVPDPIIGDVINFVDAARPIVSYLGPRVMPSATWHRPKVTQHVTVGKQGSAGAAADEKSELVSQKMTITRIDGNAVTYGGYVNVSRQNIDFSSPAAMDAIVNDLAAQYAIQTEAAVGAALVASANTIEVAGTGAAAFTQANLTAALWTAAANIYTATKGQGKIFLAVPPDQLGNWGAIFNPVNPQNAQSTGFNANGFGQGVMGQISGIPVLVSSGVTAGTVGVVASTAAVEVYEQRVGTLQVTEPSVLGVQVAYAGYFTPMTVETGGVQRLINLA
jgi:HK97 family phage major capsid protein